MQFDNGILHHKDILDLSLNNEVDLVVTSPPYNLSIKYDNKDDTMPFPEYIEWCRQWATVCYNALKTDGRFCLNIPMKITQPHDKKNNIALVQEFVNLFKDIGFGFNNIIVWDKGNINKTCWGSFGSASSPFIRDPAECIVIFYKDQWGKINKKGDNDITNTEFVKWTQNVWKFGAEKRKSNPHPAPFPKELPLRCIKMLSYIGDTIFDPFMGSGTTAVAAEELKRKWIGCEISEQYYKDSTARVSDICFAESMFGE